MNYKMIFFDLDGTLLKPDFTLSPEIKNILLELRNMGLRVAIATGRSYNSAEPYIKALKINEPCIFSNGAVIYKNTGEKQIIAAISLATTFKILELQKQMSISLKIFMADGRIYKSDHTTWPNEDLHFITGEVTTDWENVINEPPVKIVLYTHPRSIAEDFCYKVVSELGAACDIRSFSSLQHLIEITHKNVSKGKAIQMILPKLGVQLDEIIAVGDQENDFEMLHDCGLGVLIGKGSPRLLEVCDYQFPSPQDDGIADFLKFIKKSMLLTKNNANVI